MSTNMNNTTTTTTTASSKDEANRLLQKKAAEAFQRVIVTCLNELIDLVMTEQSEGAFTDLSLYQLQFVLGQHFNIAEKLAILDDAGQVIPGLAQKSRLEIYLHPRFQKMLRDNLVHRGFSAKFIDLQQLDQEDVTFQKAKAKANFEKAKAFEERKATNGKKGRKQIADPVKPNPKRERGETKDIMFKVRRPYGSGPSTPTLFDYIKSADRSRLGKQKGKGRR